MSLPDLPLDELRRYRPALPAPDDMGAFWSDTLAQAAAHPIAAVFRPVQTGLRLIDTFDVTFAGHAGQPVRGWLHVPAGSAEQLPCVVQYVGYGGGRGLPHENLLWAAAGYAHFIMDVRGQGSAWSVGETADPEPASTRLHSRVHDSRCTAFLILPTTTTGGCTSTQSGRWTRSGHTMRSTPRGS